MDSPLFDCRSYRRFGVEIEINTLDGSTHRPDTLRKQISPGADLLAHIVHKATNDRVEIQSWDYIHNNNDWIIKHDTSCGMEINSPVLKGWHGLEKLLKVVDSIGKSKLKADRRCSLHVHINIADLRKHQLASIIAHYIKCEHVLFDSFPYHRKNNRYCQFLGVSDMFNHDTPLSADDLISKISSTKYYSMNAYHFMRGGGFTTNNDRRLSVELRMAENSACVDPFYVKNWIRLLLHFFDIIKYWPMPYDYIEGDQWSGLLWLDTNEVFNMLGFDNENNLSEGMKQVRNWFIARLKENTVCDLPGVWSSLGRSRSWAEIPNASEMKEEDALYGKKYII